MQFSRLEVPCFTAVQLRKPAICSLCRGGKPEWSGKDRLTQKSRPRPRPRRRLVCRTLSFNGREQRPSHNHQRCSFHHGERLRASYTSMSALQSPSTPSPSLPKELDFFPSPLVLGLSWREEKIRNETETFDPINTYLHLMMGSFVTYVAGSDQARRPSRGPGRCFDLWVGKRTRLLKGRDRSECRSYLLVRGPSTDPSTPQQPIPSS